MKEQNTVCPARTQADCTIVTKVCSVQKLRTVLSVGVGAKRIQDMQGSRLKKLNMWEIRNSVSFESEVCNFGTL